MKRKELQQQVHNTFEHPPRVLAEDSHLLKTEQVIIKRGNGSIKIGCVV